MECLAEVPLFLLPVVSNKYFSISQINFNASLFTKSSEQVLSRTFFLWGNDVHPRNLRKDIEGGHLNGHEMAHTLGLLNTRGRDGIGLSFGRSVPPHFIPKFTRVENDNGIVDLFEDRLSKTAVKDCPPQRIAKVHLVPLCGHTRR